MSGRRQGLGVADCWRTKLHRSGPFIKRIVFGPDHNHVIEHMNDMALAKVVVVVVVVVVARALTACAGSACHQRDASQRARSLRVARSGAG